MHRLSVGALAGLVTTLVAAACAWGAPGPTDTQLPIARCDPLDPAVCLQPWPNDFFTVADATTDTGRRLNLDILGMPRNVEGKPVDPSDWNRNDGFSPGSEIITKVPGLDTQQAFDATGAVPIYDMARAFDPDQPIVLINTKTGNRSLIWSELDSNPDDPADRNLIIRPGKNLAEGTRYIVALRNLRDKDGNLLQPGAAFKAIRDGTPTSDAAIEARRASFEGDKGIFKVLARAGIQRSNLYLAWDFTVGSERSLTERMLAIRNDALAKLGDTNLADLQTQGHAPAFQITRIENNVDEFIARRVQGTYTVPCYLNLPGCPSGSRFMYLPGSNTPLALPGNTMTARFACNIPYVALQGSTPARPSLYGHGLFGSRFEVNQGQARRMAQEHNFVYCATDWSGMACADLPDDPTKILTELQSGILPTAPNCDIPVTAAIEHDLSLFPALVDRVQQGMLNFIYLGRLLVAPGGFNSKPAFQTASGRGVIDTTRLFYDGNSQGGIIGGALIAVEPDLDRGVLGVPGMNYSTLLQRSTDFGTGKGPAPDPGDVESVLPEYAYILYQSYPNELERQLVFSLMQQLWDRGEANGYARHMTSDPLPNTPAHTVLLHMGLGDHQVSQYAAEVEARTIGARARTPWADPGRDTDVDPIFQIPAINKFPYFGSAAVLWDIGPLRTEGGQVKGTPPPPREDKAPSQGQDPHEAPRNEVSSRVQKSEFLKVNGRLIDVCGTRPCYAFGWTGP